MDHQKTEWFVYMLKCSDNSIYTGITNNLQKRINSHNNKTGAKYTMGRTPVKLIYSEVQSNRSLASKREREIKILDRKSKLEMIKNYTF